MLLSEFLPFSPLFLLLLTLITNLTGSISVPVSYYVP